MGYGGACSQARALGRFGVVALAVLLGCREAGVRDGDSGAETTLIDDDGPVALSYVCGNRFLVMNSYSVPVAVTWHIVGSEEDGAATLGPAPADEPAYSELMVETRTRGALQLSVDGKLVGARPNDGVVCTPDVGAPALAAGSVEDAGEWTAPFAWPGVAVNLSLLPDGRVLTWGHAGVPQVWDPATGQFTAVPSPALLFCAGQTLNDAGRVVVAGGHIANNRGLPNMTVFDAAAKAWTSAGPMALGRWYPTTTTMSNGDIVILAGRDQAGRPVKLPEIWSNGVLRRLTSASRSLPYYPRSFLAPDGRVYVAGPQQQTFFLDIGGTGHWTTGPIRLYGGREYGAAVMYDEGRILYVGGGHTTNTAEVLDLNAASPVWTWTTSMAFARRHLNAVLLPTGDVLVVGGTGGTAGNDLSKAVHAAEMWDPSTGRWTTLAGNTVNRGYHTTAILLPDGRVLLSGSGDGAGAPSERNAELFKPPYLFAGSRPVISDAPTSVGYGETFDVTTADAAAIASVSLIRLGATTHAFDMNQRFQRLSFTAGSSSLTVTAPGNRNRTPPGHYMLFVVKGDGVPSVARIVRIN